MVLKLRPDDSFLENHFRRRKASGTKAGENSAPIPLKGSMIVKVLRQKGDPGVEFRSRKWNLLHDGAMVLK